MPELPFNPITAPVDQALTLPEVLAGPFGLILFLPLAPLVRLLARRWPRASVVGLGLGWFAFTAGPWATLVLVGGLAVAVAWIQWLARLVRRHRIAPGEMIAGVWIGLTLLVLPLWWQPDWAWYGWVDLRTAPLHFLGIAYFYLRLIAWGVDLARAPAEPLCFGATAAWLAYPPIMRLGPVMLRQQFLERFDAWNPRARIPWREVGRRAGLFILGGVALGVLGHNIPKVPPGGGDFFAHPEAYSTGALLGVIYGLPTQVYLLLWTYNELAAVLGLLIGIRVDNNFDWLPRATSVKDFWRRWHITVGAWLRNYIYIPLGGNRGWVSLHIAAVFLFCGVWHGASWSYVAWGASQALALSVQRRWERFADARWPRRVTNPAWVLASWVVTLNYQVLTVLVFVDFEHLGARILPEALRRIAGA